MPYPSQPNRTNTARNRFQEKGFGELNSCWLAKGEAAR